MVADGFGKAMEGTLMVPISGAASPRTPIPV